MPTTPQDRKPKVKHFSFKVGTKSYTLPPVSKGQAALTGRDLRDASLGGDSGQLAYMFKALEACEPTQAALDAIYSLPQAEMLDVLQGWAQHGDGDGASLGESSRSPI